MSVLGIDVGTTTCKGLALSKDGKILAQKQCGYSARPTVANGCAELNAEVFSKSVFSLIKELAFSVKNLDPIRAIALSTHGETLIPTDENGQALRPALLSMDRRCLKQTEFLAERVGAKRFYEICGTPIHTQYPVPKIAWLQENEPQIARKTARYCTAQDYLHGALGVGGYVDYSLASRFGGFDIKEHKWSSEILSAVGINERLFSVPVSAGKGVGKIPSSVAKQLNLDDGVTLVLGGHDQPCSALGMGAKPSVITVSAGSYECATVMTEQPLNAEDGYRYGLNSYCHVLEDKYVTLAFFASGLTVNWFAEKLCPFYAGDVKNLLKDLEKISPQNPTGITFTPHAYGSMNPRWDDKAKAKVLGLTAETDIGALYRALLEGAACELDLNLYVLEKLSGKKKEVNFCGGGASSGLWMQIRADVLDRTVYRLEDGVDTSCLGAAILAGVGSEVFEDAEQAIQAINYSKTAFEPKNAAAYRTQKQTYRALYEGVL